MPFIIFSLFIFVPLTIILSEDVVFNTEAPAAPRKLIQFNFNNMNNSSNDSSPVLISKPAMPRHSGIVVHNGSQSFNMTFGQQANVSVESIKGKTLRVVGIKEPPFVNYFNLSSEAYEANDKTGPGIVMDILREVGNKYDLKYEFVDPVEPFWGANNNGNWTGLIGMIQRKEADILAGATIVRSDRHEVLDFPSSFLGSETGMLILSPDQNVDNTFLIVTAPFSVTVWLVTLAIIVASGLLFKLFCKLLNEASEVQYTVIGSVWVFFSVFVQQGLPVQPKSWTCRTMLAFWWLAALTLVATFTGNMVALFAVSRSSFPFKNQEEMVYKVKSGGYQIALTNTTDTRTLFIKHSELELFQTLWYEMNVRKKWINVSNLEDGIKEVIKRRSVILLGPKETLQGLAARDCNVTTLDKGLIPIWYSIGLQKDSPYKAFFDKEIQVLVENGFIAKWLNDYTFKLSAQRGRMCLYSEGYSAAGVAITKERAQGAFWILLAGLCMGLAAFSYESLYRLAKVMVSKTMIRMNIQTKDGSGETSFNSTTTNFGIDMDKYTESVNSYRPTGFVASAQVQKTDEQENTRKSLKFRKKIVRF